MEAWGCPATSMQSPCTAATIKRDPSTKECLTKALLMQGKIAEKFCDAVHSELSKPGKEEYAKELEAATHILLAGARYNCKDTVQLAAAMLTHHRPNRDIRKALYKLLIAPLVSANLLDNGKEGKHLQIIPDTTLSLVPFAALMNGKRFLIEDYEAGISFTPSLQVQV